MPVRPATPADEPALVDLCTAAFFDEALFGKTIHPHRHQYPDDVKIFWHETIRKYFATPNTVVLAATRPDANGEEKVAGIAVWERQGEDDGAKRVKAGWVDYGAFPPLPSTHNRALDPTKRNVLDESMPFSAHLWAGDRSNNWYLSLCGIHPEYQGKGVGKELVAWGQEKARQEGVHASVIASEGNDGFYLRCGFDEVVGDATGGEGNPLNGVGGGSVLFMWPKEEIKQ
ncbi:hypothetical protein NX059_002809 [Plenodomus lindquistii]|nr:hypothetical protein NX059_002809 [Plenodomus lindquistii]